MARSSTTFKTGCRSANPGGRKKSTYDIVGACQKLGPDFIAILKDIALDDKAGKVVRIKATEILLDRGFGKPIQRNENNEEKKETTIIIVKESGQNIVTNNDFNRTVSL